RHRGRRGRRRDAAAAHPGLHAGDHGARPRRSRPATHRAVTVDPPFAAARVTHCSLSRDETHTSHVTQGEGPNVAVECPPTTAAPRRAQAAPLGLFTALFRIRHVARSETAGSTRAARAAGSRPAARPMPTRVTRTSTIRLGSRSGGAFIT